MRAAAITATTTTAVTKPSATGAGARGRAVEPDRLSVLLMAAAGFLLVLALLAGQLRATGATVPLRSVVVLRRVYETRVVESTHGRAGPGANGASVTQSVSSSGSAVGPPAPTTRSS